MRQGLTVDEVAEILGLSRNSAYKAVLDGTIPAIRIGRRWVIPKAAFDAWLREASTGRTVEAA